MYRLALPFLLLIGGCATSHLEQLDFLNKAKICCDSIQGLPIAGKLEGDLRVSLTMDSPVFAFSTGRSAFFAFVLPKSETHYQLELRTLPVGRVFSDGAGQGAHQYLYPVLLLLDESQKEIGAVHNETLIAGCHGFGCTYSFYNTISVPPQARYAVLHTIFSKIGQNYNAPMRFPGGGFMAGGVTVIYSSSVRPLSAQFGATGEVLITHLR